MTVSATPPKVVIVQAVIALESPALYKVAALAVDPDNDGTCPVLNVVKQYQESEFRGGGLIIARHVKSEFVKNYLVTNNVVQRMTLIQFVLIS